MNNSRLYFIKLRGESEELVVARDSAEALAQLKLSPLALMNIEHIRPVSAYREKDAD